MPLDARHRFWLAHANGPIAPRMPKFIRGVGPAYKNNPLSYYDRDSNTIYLLPDKGNWGSRQAMFHELGHALDTQVFSDADREAMRRYIGPGNPQWTWTNDPSKGPQGKQPYEENFANAYAEMEMHPRKFRAMRRYIRRALVRYNQANPPPQAP